MGGSPDSRPSRDPASGSGPSGSRSTVSSPSRDREPEGPDPETVSAPVTAATTILAILVGAGLLAVGVGALAAGLVGAVAGGLLTATVTATKRRTPGGRALGSVLAVVTALGLTAAIGLAAASGSLSGGLAYRVALVVAVALAAFGATATITGAVGGSAVRSALPVTACTSLPVAVVAAAHAEPVRSRARDLAAIGPGDSGGGVAALLLSPDHPAVAVGSFVALLAGCCWAVAVVLPRLPIPELVPRDRRPATRLRVERIATRAGQIGLALLPVSGGLAAAAALGRVAGIDPPYDVHAILEARLLPLATATGVRVALLAAIGLLAALLLLAWLPGLYRLRYNPLVGWLPAFAGGAIVSLLLTVGYPRAFDRWLAPALEARPSDGGSVAVPALGEFGGATELVSLLEPPAGIAIAAAATASTIGTVTAVLLAIWLLGSVGPLPDRGAPGSLAAAALVAGAIVAALGGAGAVVVSGAVACALVAWDAAAYGVSMTEELGRGTSVRQPALAHALGAVLTGFIGVVVAVGLPRLLGTVTVRTGVTIAVSLVLALLVSFAVLKRRATTPTRSPSSTAGSEATPTDARAQRLEDE